MASFLKGVALSSCPLTPGNRVLWWLRCLREPVLGLCCCDEHNTGQPGEGSIEFILQLTVWHAGKTVQALEQRLEEHYLSDSLQLFNLAQDHLPVHSSRGPPASIVNQEKATDLPIGQCDGSIFFIKAPSSQVTLVVSR